MSRRISTNKSGPQESRGATRSETSGEVLFRGGVFEIRDSSDPHDSGVCLTLSELKTILRHKELGPDFIRNNASEPREARRLEGKNLEGDEAQPHDIYGFLKWAIEYATDDGEKNRRFRFFVVMMILVCCCGIILVAGTCIAVHVGMPQLVAYGLSVGGSAAFALVATLVSKFRRRKANQKSP
jgi:hypothetical protein